MRHYSKKFMDGCLYKFENKTGQTCHSQRYRKSIGERAHIFEAGFKLFEGANILDMGCFTGFYSCMMSTYAKHVLGIDLNGKAISHANLLKSYFGCKNVEFRKFSAFKIAGKFMVENNITGLFLHKSMSIVSGWTEERQQHFWKLIKKYVNVTVASSTKLVSRKVDILRPVFSNDSKFKIIELGDHLTAIVRRK